LREAWAGAKGGGGVTRQLVTPCIEIGVRPRKTEPRMQARARRRPCKGQVCKPVNVPSAVVSHYNPTRPHPNTPRGRRLYRPHDSALRRVGKELLSCLLLVLQLFQLSYPWGVGVSRFRDNRHNASDVRGGRGRGYCWARGGAGLGLQGWAGAEAGLGSERARQGWGVQVQLWGTCQVGAGK
jgi:hypothetical protein